MIRSWTEVRLDKKFSGTGWLSRVTGAGTVSVTGNILSANAATGDVAVKDYFIPILPGQRVEVDVWCRWQSGSPGLWLYGANFGGVGSQREKQLLRQIDDWMLYRIGYTVPITPSSPFLRLSVGVNDTAAGGQGQFKRPTVRVSGGYGTKLVLARGLIKILPTAPSVVLHPNFPSYGVASVTYDNATQVTVTLETDLISYIASGYQPHILCSGTVDHPFIPVAGQVAAGSPGTFFIKWSNGAAIQDIHLLAGPLFAFFEVSY